MKLDSELFTNLFYELKNLSLKNNIEFQLYLENGNFLFLEVQNQNLAKFETSTWTRGTLKLISEGIHASTTFENLEPKSIEKYYRLTFENLNFLKKNKIPNKFTKLQNPDSKNIETSTTTNISKCNEISFTDKVNLLLELETQTINANPLVHSSNLTAYIEIYTSERVLNSLGLDRSFEKKVYSMDLRPIIKNDKQIKRGRLTQSNFDFYKLNVEKFAITEVQNTVQQLNPQSIQSGSYPILIDREASPRILKMLESYFSAQAVDENTSLFQYKINEQVASNLLTIIDDPHTMDGTAYRPFDSEGTTSQKTILIENGILKNYLSNLEYSEKLNIPNTGHGTNKHGDSFISPTNLYIQAGHYPLNDLINHYPKFIYITKFIGPLHSTFKSSTGDFSIPCQGFLYVNGKSLYPVDQFIISGNILSLINKIVSVGNNYGIYHTDRWAPDLLFESMDIASKSEL